MDFNSSVSFIRNTFNTSDFIPLHVPQFSGNEKKYVLDTIESTFVSSVGAYVNQFEEQISEFTKTAKGVAVVNGTAALQIAMKLAGVSEGDEVITQALTFVATVNAISYNNARPVFVDVDRDTMGMSPKALLDFLEEFGEKRDDATYNKSTGKRIAACVPMHTFGFMCRIDEIVEICNKWSIPIVEDAAESLGSTFRGRSAGSFGKMGAFSFNGNKIITAGGGGAIVSNDVDLADKAKYLTTTAKVPHKWEYVHDEIGYNYRMPNLNAALVCAQLEQFENFRSRKAALYAEYEKFFAENGILLKPIPEDTDNWNYWFMSLELENLEERNAFLKTTNEAGVMTRPIWQLMYRLPMFANCQRDSQANAEYLEERIVNIPSSAIG